MVGTHEELASELEEAGCARGAEARIDVAVTRARRAVQLSDPTTGPGACSPPPSWPSSCGRPDIAVAMLRELETWISGSWSSRERAPSAS